MPVYCYKTCSGECEGKCSEVSLEGCCGRFEMEKRISEASKPEKCRFCNAQLVKDIVAQGAPAASFVGPGFHKNDYKG